VISFFCDIACQKEQTTLHILQWLLYQTVQQGDEQVISTLKRCCDDPSKLQTTKDISGLLSQVCLVRPIFLVIDAPDELDDSNGLFSSLQPLRHDGLKMLVMSRDNSNILARNWHAETVEVQSDFEDIKVYAERRLRDNDFSDELNTSKDLVDEIAASASNM
jgi:hypothetical protein